MPFSPFPRARIAASLAAFVLVTIGSEMHARAERQVCAGSSEEGQRQRKDGKLVAARSLFLVCSSAECPAVVREDCTQWLAEVETDIPSIVLAVHDASGKDLTASVLIDGASSRIPDGHPDFIDPGSHLLRVELDGKVIESHVIVNQGEKNKLIVISVDAAAAPDAPKKSQVVAMSTRPIYPYILGGAGLVALGIGVALQLGALSQDSASNNLNGASTTEIEKNPTVCGVANPPATSCPQTSAKNSDYQAAKNEQSLSLPFMGIGLGVMIAGVIAFIATWPSPVAAKTSVRFVPAVNGKESSMMLLGTF